MFYLEEKLPIFDKESDILLGNGLTLAFLLGNNYQSNYLFKSFDLIFNKVKKDSLFTECLKTVLPKKFKIFIEEYNEDIIKNFIEYSQYCFNQLLENDQLARESLEYLQHDNVFLTDYYINDLTYRMAKNKTDFESWFLFVDLITLILQQRALVAKTRYEFASDKEYKETLSIFQDLFDRERFIKAVLVFWLYNHDETENKLISVELKPILDSNKINFKKKLLLSNRIMTLNYDTFLEKILEINNIHHIHGRLDKIVINNKIINISSKNLSRYFSQILDNILLSSFPLAKRAERNGKLLRFSTELEMLIGVSNVDRKYFAKINEFLTKNSNWNDTINFLNSEKNIYRYTNNKKLIIMGVRPKSDMSYIIDVIRNYDEVYISYYNEEDKIGLTELVNWLNDILEEKKTERKNWDLFHLRNKSIQDFKIKIFNIYEVTKIGTNNFDQKEIELKSNNIYDEIMKRLQKNKWEQPSKSKVIEALKTFKVLVENIIENFKKKYHSSMWKTDDNKDFKLIKDFAMKNKSTEILYCYYEFEVMQEVSNKYFFNGLLNTIKKYLEILSDVSDQ